MLELVKNSIIALPISVIYFIVASMVGEVIYKDVKVEDRQVNVSIIMFIAALIGLFIGYFLFGQNTRFNNKGIQWGLILGSIGLLFHTLVRNWEVTSNEYKLGVFSVILAILIWGAYRVNK